MAKTKPDETDETETDPTETRRGEEIDLNAEEEAALDRAWERMRREEALRKLQPGGSGKAAAADEDEEAP